MKRIVWRFQFLQHAVLPVCIVNENDAMAFKEPRDVEGNADCLLNDVLISETQV